MVTIRVFRTRTEAETACKMLKNAGFYAEVSEDKIFNVPIQKYNVPARFRLNIFSSDMTRISSYLAKKLKSKY